MKKIITLMLVLAGIVCTASAQIAESGKITVYFQNTQNWTGPFYIYFEKGSEHYGYDWPGKLAETTTIDGETWYYRTEEVSGDNTGFQAKFNNDGTNEAIWNNVWYDVYATIDASSATHRYNTYFLYNTDTELSTRLDNEGTSIYSTTIDNQASPSNQYYVVANIAAYDYSTKIKSDKWDSEYVIRPNGAVNGTAVKFETMDDFTLGWSNNSSGSWFISSAKPAYYTFKYKSDHNYKWDAYITRTLPSAGEGYATFSCDYDVIPQSGLIAKYATAASPSAGITWENYPTSGEYIGIKAGEGALLIGTKGTEYKFTPATSAYKPATNLLKAINAETTLNQHGSNTTNYILTKVGEHVGFFKVNSAGSVVKEGTAYLEVTGSFARDFFDFDDDPSRIDAVKNVQVDGQYFNLSGQRVAEPTKGLYIVNGKKIVIK